MAVRASRHPVLVAQPGCLERSDVLRRRLVPRLGLGEVPTDRLERSDVRRRTLVGLPSAVRLATLILVALVVSTMFGRPVGAQGDDATLVAVRATPIEPRQAVRVQVVFAYDADERPVEGATVVATPIDATGSERRPTKLVERGPAGTYAAVVSLGVSTNAPTDAPNWVVRVHSDDPVATLDLNVTVPPRPPATANTAGPLVTSTSTSIPADSDPSGSATSAPADEPITVDSGAAVSGKGDGSEGGILWAALAGGAVALAVAAAVVVNRRPPLDVAPNDDVDLGGTVGSDERGDSSEAGDRADAESQTRSSGPDGGDFDR